MSSLIGSQIIACTPVMCGDYPICIFTVYLVNSNTQSQYISRQVILFTKQANRHGSKLYISNYEHRKDARLLGYDNMTRKKENEIRKITRKFMAKMHNNNPEN